MGTNICKVAIFALKGCFYTKEIRMLLEKAEQRFLSFGSVNTILNIFFSWGIKYPTSKSIFFFEKIRQ